MENTFKRLEEALLSVFPLSRCIRIFEAYQRKKFCLFRIVLVFRTQHGEEANLQPSELYFSLVFVSVTQRQ